VTGPAHARLDQDGGVLTVWFERPEKLNAISPQMAEVLWEGVRTAGERDDVRALVITGTGRYLSAGFDLAAPAPGHGAPGGREFRRQYRDYHRLYDEIEALEKPVVLAAQGPCVGAALELACACDLRLCTSEARFWLPEVSLGVIAGSGGTSRLTRLVGPHWAKWIAMAGRTVDAERALAIGLVHDVLPVEGFHEAVAALVADVIRLPAEALGLEKLAIDMAADVDRATGRNLERLANTHLMLSGEYRGDASAERRRR
jgi:enoyl-CoA hydratase/carnithine racemase